MRKNDNGTPWLEQYVDVRLFKDGRDYRDDVFVSINGESCLIKRGEWVQVKRKFALLLEQCERQDEYAEALMAGRAYEYAAAGI